MIFEYNQYYLPEVGCLRLEAQKKTASNLESRHRRDDPQAKRSSNGAPRALRIMVAGGGTGGHLFPGIAIAKEFTARNSATRDRRTPTDLHHMKI